jgi:hypothetical protein
MRERHDARPAGQRGENLPAQQHSSTRGKPPTANCLPTCDSWETTRSRFPDSEGQTCKQQGGRERRDPRRSADAAGERDRETTAGWANSLDEPMASERGWFAVSPAVAVSLDRFATFEPHISTTSLSDIPLPLNPRRHQLITNLPDTFIITTASRTPICKSRGKNLPDRES